MVMGRNCINSELVKFQGLLIKFFAQIPWTMLTKNGPAHLIIYHYFFYILTEGLFELYFSYRSITSEKKSANIIMYFIWKIISMIIWNRHGFSGT